MQKCSSHTGCTFTVPSNCVIYTGSYLPNYGILTSTTLTDILKIIDLAKVDISSDVLTNNTNSIQFFGTGSTTSPLYANVLISTASNNNLSIVTGNVTNNAILVNGQNNFYNSESGLQFYYNSLGYGVIESKDDNNLNRLDIRS